MSIKALEEEMEVALLHRTHKGVSLTAEGQALVSLYGDFQKGVAQIKRQKLSIEGELIPVSYTHLDVYKRQVF